MPVLRRIIGIAGLAAILAGAAHAATAPAGLLTPLEAKRHQSFVEGSRGDVDLLFIGDSAIDFWRYDWGGKSVWDAHYAGRGAVNLGSRARIRRACCGGCRMASWTGSGPG